MGITKFFGSAIEITNTEVFTKTADLLVNNLLLNQNRKLFRINYTVAGHAPISGAKPYYLNHVAIINDDFIPFNNQYMTTYGVMFEGSKDRGMTTTLSLGLPSISSQILSGYYKALLGGVNPLVPGISKLSTDIGHVMPGTGI
jgi:hypothetical protein